MDNYSFAMEREARKKEKQQRLLLRLLRLSIVITAFAAGAYLL